MRIPIFDISGTLLIQQTPLPGVQNLLAALDLKHVPMGVFTAYSEDQAWEKLKLAGIRDFFTFGGFAGGGHKNAELLEIARQRAQEFLGRDVDRNELIIVSDDPLDIKMAQEAQIKSVGVASGRHGVDDLTAAGADYVVSSMLEIDTLLHHLAS